MTEDTFCQYCMVISARYSERGRATLEKDEKTFAIKDSSLKKMIERFKRELKKEVLLQARDKFYQEKEKELKVLEKK